MTAVPERLPASTLPAAGRTACVVMLGSNIEPHRYLPWAVQELATLGNVAAVSSVWQTAPIGFLDQADFCNAAVLLDTPLEPSRLLGELRDIEARLGRIRDPRNKNAPRTIDLDLAVIPGPPRVIAGRMFPDPEISERVFLAAPLLEILPEFHLPTGRSLRDVAADLRERDAARLRLKQRDDIEFQPGVPHTAPI